jgi:hypothetical protein
MIQPITQKQPELQHLFNEQIKMEINLIKFPLYLTISKTFVIEKISIPDF